MYMHVYFSAGHDNLSAALWSLFHDIWWQAVVSAITRWQDYIKTTTIS